MTLRLCWYALPDSCYSALVAVVGPRVANFWCRVVKAKYDAAARRRPAAISLIMQTAYEKAQRLHDEVTADNHTGEQQVVPDEVPEILAAAPTSAASGPSTTKDGIQTPTSGNGTNGSAMEGIDTAITSSNGTDQISIT
ncbi:hypothetical protein GGI21_000372 [Coemansia aciculifera]|nr:hypothetical protein GGI21_000372 [Coemansia aciculifera]